MDKFRYEVTLTIEVEAFDDGDAWEAVQDNFGLGQQGDILVTDFEAKELP
ncbi:MAG: hypothetical protein WBK76_02795 [Candidatus Saccharimonadales bacterium]